MRRRILGSIAVLVAFLFVQNPAHANSGGLDSLFNQYGARAQGWVKLPGSDVPVEPPPGYIDTDPNQYSYALQCQVDDDTIDVDCLPGQIECEPREPGGDEGIPIVWRYAPKSISNPAWSDWKSEGGPSCLYDPKPEDVLGNIAARIANDFKQLPIQAAKVTVQPGPHTLKGMETNVFAAASEQSFDVVILGQNVHLEATPVEYTYNYGDGATFGPTMFAGGSISEEEWGTKTRTSHTYKQTGDFRLTVTTGFRGTYSVNGGPPLPITGNGSFASPAQTVSVWRTETRQVAENCIENPNGWACPGSETEAK